MISLKWSIRFGVVLAVLGVALAGSFAPDSKVTRNTASVSVAEASIDIPAVDDPIGTPSPAAMQAGANYYVATNGNNNNPGTVSQPWRTIQYAAGRVTAGATVWIRGGTYAEQVVPANSGNTTAGAITYKAYPGELPIIDGGNNSSRLYNIQLVNRQFITFDGIRVEEPWVSWVLIERSHYITLQNMQFMNPNYPSSMVRNFWGIDIRYGNYNRILYSTLDRWGRYDEGDSEGNHIGIHGNNGADGLYNLIEGNTFTYGAQGCIIINASYNIIRRNTFYNDWQKGIYIGWFTNPGGEPAGTNWMAYRNLVEDNQFIRSNNSEYDHGGLGIESTAAGSIIRRNVMRNNDHFGLIITVFGNGYALRDYQTHIYNNTIVYNGLDRFQYRGHGLTISNHGLGYELHDTVVKNNIIFGNLTHADGNVNHINIEVTGPSSNNPPYGRTLFVGNLIENPRATTCQNRINSQGQGGGDCPIYIDGIGSGNVAFWQARNPTYFYGNREGNPAFANYDPASGRFDLTLLPGSPAIDTGAPLTYTRSAGSGNVLPVYDSFYFADGYGNMIQPDIIRVGSQIARVASINLSTHNITLDRSLTWGANAPVNLQYFGNAPDIGAIEFSQPDTLVLFNPTTRGSSFTHTIQDLPPTSGYSTFNTGFPNAGAQWVVGDWNGDGVKTPGAYLNGAFYFTNTIGQTTSWGSIWIGPAGIPVAGRFDAAVANDCIGAVQQINTVFAMYYACSFTTGNQPTIRYQWLSELLPTAGGHSGAWQFAAGDWDGNGVDSIAVRRGPSIAFTNTPPTTVNSLFNLAQYIGTPSTNDYGVFVAGDWDSNRLDSFGLVYSNGYFYRRNDLTWNSGLYYIQRVGQPVSTPMTAVTWRSGGGIAGTSGETEGELEGIISEPATSAPEPTAEPTLNTVRLLVESDDPLVTREGNWASVDVTAASGGRYLTVAGSNTTENALTLEFTGTSLEVIYTETIEPGSFTIVVDDVAVRTVIIPGGISQPAFNQRSVISYFEPGPHTLRIVAVDGTVAIDAFDLTVIEAQE